MWIKGCWKHKRAIYSELGHVKLLIKLICQILLRALQDHAVMLITFVSITYSRPNKSGRHQKNVLCFYPDSVVVTLSKACRWFSTTHSTAWRSKDAGSLSDIECLRYSRIGCLSKTSLVVCEMCCSIIFNFLDYMLVSQEILPLYRKHCRYIGNTAAI